MTEIRQRTTEPRAAEHGRCPFCGGKTLKHCSIKACQWVICADLRCRAFGPIDGMVRL